jgi:hypothetical protein
LSNELTDRVTSDFSRARLMSFLNRVRSLFSGAPYRLLSYDEVKASLHLGGPIYRGMTVRATDAGT